MAERPSLSPGASGPGSRKARMSYLLYPLAIALNGLGTTLSFL